MEGGLIRLFRLLHRKGLFLPKGLFSILGQDFTKVFSIVSPIKGESLLAFPTVTAAKKTEEIIEENLYGFF